MQSRKLEIQTIAARFRNLEDSMLKPNRLFLLLITLFVAITSLGVMCDPPMPQFTGIEPSIISFDSSIDYKAFTFYAHLKDTIFMSGYDSDGPYPGGVRADYTPIRDSSFSSYVGDTAIISLAYSKDSSAKPLVLDTFLVAHDFSMHWVAIGHPLPYRKDYRQPTYSKKRFYSINGKLDTLYYYAFF